VTNTTGVPTWLTTTNGSQIFEDWIANNAQGSTNWTNVQNGTGAGVAINPANISQNHPGVVRLDAGSATNSRAILHKGLDIIQLGGGTVTFEAQVRISQLYDGTNHYRLMIGFGDNAGGGTFTDGVYFMYDSLGTFGLASNNWIIATKDGGANDSTKVETSSQVSANSWIKLAIGVDAGGTSVTYYVNGVSIGTITTRIPTGSGELLAPIFKIVNTAGTGTGRALDVDYAQFTYLFSTAR
jgi:hypothetical protein